MEFMKFGVWAVLGWCLSDLEASKEDSPRLGQSTAQLRVTQSWLKECPISSIWQVWEHQEGDPWEGGAPHSKSRVLAARWGEEWLLGSRLPCMAVKFVYLTKELNIGAARAQSSPLCQYPRLHHDKGLPRGGVSWTRSFLASRALPRNDLGRGVFAVRGLVGEIPEALYQLGRVLNLKLILLHLCLQVVGAGITSLCKIYIYLHMCMSMCACDDIS